MVKNMIVGIGTDILRIDRLRRAAGTLAVESSSFIRNTYTEKEIILAEERKEPYNFYATRFAGKEAVLKALACEGGNISLRQIEILSGKYGEPKVVLHKEAERIRQSKKINRILISLSYDSDYAIAYVVCESEEKGKNEQNI